METEKHSSCVYMYDWWCVWRMYNTCIYILHLHIDWIWTLRLFQKWTKEEQKNRRKITLTVYNKLALYKLILLHKRICIASITTTKVMIRCSLCNCIFMLSQIKYREYGNYSETSFQSIFSWEKHWATSRSFNFWTSLIITLTD